MNAETRPCFLPNESPMPRPRQLSPTALVALMLVATASAADRPEVVQVRVPEEKVRSFFPAGTELRVLPMQDFETLLKSVREAERPGGRADGSPRLLRAKHEARWEDGTLIGRSEFLTETSPNPASTVILDPWSPALDGETTSKEVVRVGPDHRLGLQAVGTVPKTLSLSWEQRAKAGSEGRGFVLALPAIAACRLTLDLPVALVPEIAGTLRQGPAPGSTPDRRAWRFDGPGGSWRIRLQAPRDPEGPASPVWVSGTTRIDASDTPARWSLDWSVDPGPSGPRRFGVALDPGLDLIDVTGPRVASFRSEPSRDGPGTTVTVRLDDGATGPTPVTIRALVRMPDDGPWRVPSARPIGAVWTGGRTLVHLGPALVVSGCNPLGARQVTPTAQEREFVAARPGLVLAFQGTSPTSPAELLLRRSPTDSSAEVKGRLVLSARESARLEAEITWRVDRGRLSTLAADLPVGWTPERAQIRGLAQATAWHAETRPGGGARLVAHLPPSHDPSVPVTLDVAAVAVAGERRGPLELPRIVPIGVRVADEVWLVRAETGMTVSPRKARGLVWLDPTSAVAEPSKGPPRPPGTRLVLAWRWTAADGRGVLDRVAASAPRAAEAWTVATVFADRLRLDHFLDLGSGDPERNELFVAFTGDDNTPAPRWDVQGHPERIVETTPIPPADRAAAGLPLRGTAWKLVLARGVRDRMVLHARMERAWSGAGTVPLIVLPERDLMRASLLVSVDRGLRAETVAPGLTVLDPAWAWNAFDQVVAPVEKAEAPRSHLRPLQAFGYGSGSSSPRLTSETLPAAAPGGLVQDAILTTRTDPSGRAWCHLALRIVPGPDRMIEVTLPEGVALERAQIEGRPAIPIRTDRGLRFALPAPALSQPTVELDLDYLTTRGDGRLIRPNRPVISLPCLAFSWDVEVPPSREVANIPPVLRDAGLVSSETSVLRPSMAWTGSPVAPEDTAAIREINERITHESPEDRTLGEWLTRLDGGHAPILVDRAALEDAGLGPHSRLDRLRGVARPASAGQIFAGLGLRLVAGGGGLLVTSAGGESHPGRHARLALSDRLRKAAIAGHDDTDRIQCLPRWRGEATPGPWADRLGGGESSAVASPIRRFVAPGWPDDGASLRVVDRTGRWMLAVAIALLVVGLGLASRRSSFRLRSIAIGVIGVAGWLLLRVGPPDLEDAASALVWGALATAGLWLGSALRPSRRGPIRPQPRSVSGRQRAMGSGVATILVLAVWVSKPTSQLLAEDPPQIAPLDPGPIFVLLPYDPPFDPSVPASRVVLRLSDYDRIVAATEGPEPSPQGDQPRLTAALHEVRREGTRDARIASAFDLWASAPGPNVWSFPAEGARDLSATVDGREVPVRMVAGTTTASVAISGTGAHRLIVRRLAALVHSADGDTLRMPIPPIASARLRLEAPPEGDRVAFLAARGREVRREGILEAGLGPVETLELRWTGRTVAGPPPPRGQCDATMLWDVEPAGDRVRARITATSAEGLSRLSLALEPGLLVRSTSLAGTADALVRNVPSGTIWELPIEPPLAEGQSLTVEFWRPLPTATGPVLIRRVPRIEPLGLAGFGGLVGVRRPQDWTGRLGPAGGGESVPDADFARAWGEFPSGSATFAGASRFLGSPELALATGPPRSRPRVRPTIQVELTPGRLETRVEAAWSEVDGTSREAEIRIPGDLRVVRVESPGLTDWTRPTDDRLRLRFDAEVPSPRRTIRIDGWVPIDGDPMASGSTQSDAEIPWPSWQGADVDEGSLTIHAPSNFSFRLDPGAGVLPIAPATGTARSAFSVAPLASPGRLHWTVEPIGVNVLVQSLLTLHPSSVEWTASARYQIPWGPCPPITLRLPTEWADAARVEIVGTKIKPQVDRSGKETSWTFRPDPPMWGNLQVRVHATRPRPARGPLAFPDLLPLGRASTDRVDSYLGYADATGRPTVVEGSAELQPVDASRWDAEDLPWPATLPRNILRVLKDGWSLRFRSPDDARSPGLSAEDGGVILADLACTLSDDGSVLGRACYDLDGRPSAFLAIVLPPGAEALGANVDEIAVTPRRDHSGQILIPLPNGSAARVVFVWKGRSAGLDGDPRRAVPLPSLASPEVPTLVTVWASEDVTVEANATISSPAALELARAERLASTLARRLDQFDRGSPKERASLLAALIQFELHARATERATREMRGEAGRAIMESLSLERNSLVDALSSGGLEDFALSARARVGRGLIDPLATQTAAVDRPVPLRIRPLGREFTFRAAPARRLSVLWSKRHSGPVLYSEWLLAVGMLIPGIGVIALPSRRPRLSACIVALIALGVALASGGGPAALLVMAIAAAVGRILP
ncbi:MAG: hypothetical protein JWN86_1223 [Planctomycetota bacterium]|nr:hypothetical protein [Planctomycetota bacterium]